MNKPKKLFSMILMILLLFLSTTAFGEATQTPEQIIVSENWKGLSADSSTFSFSQDGTGSLTYSNGGGLDTTWQLNASQLTVSYELYGKRSVTYTFEQKDGYYVLSVPDNGGYLVRESDLDTLLSEGRSDIETYPVQFDEKLMLGFADITFNTAQVTSTISSKNGSYMPAAEGTQYFCVVGKISNGSSRALPVNNMSVEFTFDDAYTFSGAVTMDQAGELTSQLPPVSDGILYLYAQIPDNLVKSFKTCSVVISFNDNLAARPMMLKDGSFLFSLAMDESICILAKKGPVRETVYFEECPILPVPTSYADVFQSGSNVSSTNGKTTRIVYRYMVRGNNLKIDQVLSAYVDELTALGFSVTNNTVFASKTQLATLTLSGETLEINIKPGNEKLKDLPTPASEKAIEEANAAPKLYIGDTLKLHSAEMTLEKFGSAKEIYSSITKSGGRYTYYYSQSGNPYFYLFGNFKNKSGKPVDIRHIYAEFIFDGKYAYRADVDGVKKGAGDFIHDVSSQSSVNYYVYGEVPSDVINSFKTCTVRLGFTDDYGIKFISSGGLNNFEHCDDVFEVEIVKGGTPKKESSSSQTSTKTSDSNYTTLKPGSKGQAVLDARMKLYELGYFSKKPTQTEYTNNMMDYVKKFEKDNGLKQDGILSPEDQEVLFGL